jgi:hypothetical protein
VTSNGTLSATGGGTYTLPTASPSVKGGVRIGTGLAMSGEVLNLQPPTLSVIGGVKAGSNITISSDGVISSTSSGGGTGPQGAKGTSFYGWNSASNITNISQISGMLVGDYIVNTGTSTITILGVSSNIGDVIRSTSATAGTFAGNIRGAIGAMGEGFVVDSITENEVTNPANPLYPGYTNIILNKTPSNIFYKSFNIPWGKNGKDAEGGSGLKAFSGVQYLNSTWQINGRNGLSFSHQTGSPIILNGRGSLILDWTFTFFSNANAFSTTPQLFNNLLWDGNQSNLTGGAVGFVRWQKTRTLFQINDYAADDSLPPTHFNNTSGLYKITIKYYEVISLNSGTMKLDTSSTSNADNNLTWSFIAPSAMNFASASVEITIAN